MSEFRVTLRDSTTPSSFVTLKATPDLIETRNVNYKMIDPVHAPGQIAAYGNSSSRGFNMSNIRLISRTSDEAEENLKYLWLLRSWTVPTFGVDASAQFDEFGDFTSTLGSPPAVLYLSAYSKDNGFGEGDTSTQNKTRGHINRVPVVIQNMSIPYPSDVDYIPTTVNKIPMPTIMTLDMTMVETHSPREYETFDIASYRNGLLRGF